MNDTLYRYVVWTSSGSTFNGKDWNTFVGTRHTIEDGVLTIHHRHGGKTIFNWRSVLRVEISEIVEAEGDA